MSLAPIDHPFFRNEKCADLVADYVTNPFKFFFDAKLPIDLHRNRESFLITQIYRKRLENLVIDQSINIIREALTIYAKNHINMKFEQDDIDFLMSLKIPFRPEETFTERIRMVASLKLRNNQNRPLSILRITPFKLTSYLISWAPPHILKECARKWKRITDRVDYQYHLSIGGVMISSRPSPLLNYGSSVTELEALTRKASSLILRSDYVTGKYSDHIVSTRAPIVLTAKMTQEIAPLKKQQEIPRIVITPPPTPVGAPASPTVLFSPRKEAYFAHTMAVRPLDSPVAPPPEKGCCIDKSRFAAILKSCFPCCSAVSCCGDTPVVAL